MDPLSQFQIKTLWTFKPFSFLDLSITNLTITLVGLGLLVCFTGHLVAKQKKLVPNKIFTVFELFYNFVASVIKEQTHQDPRKYIPFVITIFTFILLGNALGVIPFLFAVNSQISITTTLSLLVFFYVVFLGIKAKQIKFFRDFIPKDVPIAILPLVVVIELISYLVRPATLSMRLCINMMAGHIMIKAIASMASMLPIQATTIPAIILICFFNVGLLCFEFLVSGLQAYIFLILTCNYIGDAINSH
ncbi:MAG: F0F1 ATP synthase subunit A [Candidatus Puniceispirillum sp.]|nr:F0F1 ATP synthase subunit A [Candidatus Pelagibacter sp.]MBA4283066.1 F0F1 ATP synthase subunit A [Candidatus Puniceispirillum sp.]